MSSILATATKTAIRLDEVAAENILLRRQVEVLATSLTEAANELAPYGAYKDRIKQWREQAKGGGG